MATRGVERRAPAEGGIKAAGWTNVILGIVVLAVPFFTAEVGAAFWNNVIVGLLIVGLAGYNAWAATQHRVESVMGPAAVNVLLGLWLVAYPFFVQASQAYFWSNVILGILVAALAAYNAYASSTARGAPAGRAGV